MSARLRSIVTLATCCLLSLSSCDKGKPAKKTDKKSDAKKTDAKKADAKKTDDKKADAKKADEKKADADAKKADAAAVLTLGAAKLMEESKPDEAIELLADGGIKLGGKPLGTVSADGTLTGPDGNAFLVVGADGKVSAKGKPIGLELVDGGGRMTMGDKTVSITFAENGTIMLDPKDSGNGPTMKHEGCSGPLAKTCALVMFGMLMPGEETTSESDPSSAPSAAPPAAPAPADAKADAKAGG